MLHEELRDATSDNTATLNVVRDLIDRVEMRPSAGTHGSPPEITLTGALGSMLYLAMGAYNAQKPQHNSTASVNQLAVVSDRFLSTVKVVAGPGFEPGTFRL
nr:hypothetical protein [uncultured Acidocella sp.]